MDGRHWPGGIPPTIFPHPHAQQDGFNFDLATQGFRKLLREHWKPRENEPDSEEFEYEDTQRRELIETWACADQAFREVGTRAMILGTTYLPLPLPTAQV